jgi:hypothetical protein
MAIRDTSYYGWENIDEYGATASNTVSKARYTDATMDRHGNLYVVGAHSSSLGHQWITRKYTAATQTWDTIDSYNSASDGFRTGTLPDGDADNTTLFQCIANTILIDSSGSIFVGGKISGSGHYAGVIRKSHITASTSWNKIAGFIPSDGGDSAVNDLAIDSSGTMFAACFSSSYTGGSTSWIIRKSTDKGLTWSAIDSVVVGLGDGCNGITVDLNDKIYACGENSDMAVVRSSSDHGTTWAYVDMWDTVTAGVGGNDVFHKIKVGTDGIVYVCGKYTNNSDRNWVIRSSSLGTTGSFGIADEYDGWAGGNSSDEAYDIALDSKNHVYAVGYRITGSGVNDVDWLVRRKYSGSIGYGANVDMYGGQIGGATITTFLVDEARGCYIDSSDNIYVVGSVALDKYAVVRKGRLWSNSASLGPYMLAPSIGYVFSEVSGTTDTRFKLMNISEFPHAGGVYQMKNLLIGTQDSGKIGKTSDAIVRVNYHGSIVVVAWPKQGEQLVAVKGYGDLSSGQRVGKLSTTFEPGEIIDVSGSDHMALYCYFRKEMSGTLDNIEIKIERKPVKDTGFATEQAVEYSTSGSYTVATLRDIIYKKEIDYGDLGIREIGFPIDVPLTNVKQVRISARHTVGQEDPNKNFIIWSRLIKSDKNTNEV